MVGWAVMPMLWLTGSVAWADLTQSVLSFLLNKTRSLILVAGTMISVVIPKFGVSWSQVAWVPRTGSFVCSE